MRLLNTSCPVNWNSPLNRGKVAWYLAHPSLPRGNTWRDLVGLSNRKGNNGTLTNGPLWGGSKGRPGGYGSLSFDGVDDAVACGTMPATTTGHTFAMWLRYTGTPGSFTRIISCTGFLLAFQQSGFRIGFYNWSNNTVVGLSAAQAPADTWHHIAGSISADTGKHNIYLNGVNTLEVGAATVSSAGTFYLGRDTGGGFNGAFLADDVTYYNRPVANIDRLYDQSKRGHPDTLNWINP